MQCFRKQFRTTDSGFPLVDNGQSAHSQPVAKTLYSRLLQSPFFCEHSAAIWAYNTHNPKRRQHQQHLVLSVPIICILHYPTAPTTIIPFPESRCLNTDYALSPLQRSLSHNCTLLLISFDTPTQSLSLTYNPFLLRYATIPTIYAYCAVDGAIW